MVAGLVDTSIVVDLIRGYVPAAQWYRQHTGLGVSRIVWLEVIEGFRDKRSQQTALTLLRRFDVVEIESEDGKWAENQLLKFKPSHNVDAFDCLIAASAFRLQIPLYTRNLKHFVPMIGNLVVRPY